MGKPKAPTPPDPQETSAASTSTNLGTAIANTTMGQVDQYGPTGSLTYDQTGTQSWSDPYTGETYDIPTYSSTTNLSPEEQAIFDVNQSSRYGMGDLANNQINFLGDYLGDSTLGAPQLQDVGSAAPSYVASGDAGDITKTYGTDFSEDRQRVEDALMARMQPSLDRERSQMEQRLANQGIVAGSEAYGRDVGAYGQRANDATMSAILGGGQEQSRLAQLEAQRAGFENQAQQQQFGQNMAMSGDQNRFNQQQWQNNMAGSQAQNAMLGNQYQLDTAARNQPINEIMALMSGGQVNQPNFQMSQPSQMATTDVGGLINQNFGQQQQNYQNQMGAWNNTMGGLFDLGAAGIKASDRRLKKNIELIGNNGFNVYEYNYIWEPDSAPLHRGYMAQEVIKVIPDAVVKFGKWLALDYSKLPEVA